MFSKATITLATLFLFGVTATAVAYEDPENKIGDRYPFLEQQYAPVATTKSATKRSVSQLDRHASEDPENKIGDRYPQLEQTYAATGNPTVTRMAVPRLALDQFAHEVPENKISDRYPLLEQPIQTAGVPSRSTVGVTGSVSSVRQSHANLRAGRTARISN